MIIQFQNILLLKDFLACNGCFGLFTKIITRSGTSSGTTYFLHDFSIKMFFIWYSIYGQSFSVIPFFLLKVANKMCYWFFFNHPLKQWPTRRKRGKDGIRKIWEKIEKSFFDEIKSIFDSFWRVIIWWKNKNSIQIADTSFKHDQINFSVF